MPDTVAIASLNPVKINAVRSGFERMFRSANFSYKGLTATSGVSAQPMSADETYQGALNRARAAAQQMPSAVYTVGIEGGVEQREHGLSVFAWVVILSGERRGQAQTGVFTLPDEVAQLVRQGLELGDADDIIFGRSNSKQANGSIGLLTDDTITRLDFYTPAVMMALIPFKKPEFTWA